MNSKLNVRVTADITAKKLKGVVYYDKLSKFYTYESGKHWQEITDHQLEAIIFNCNEDYIDLPSQAEQVRRAMRSKFMLNRHTKMNHNRNKITLSDNVLDLSTFKLVPHNKEDYSTLLTDISLTDDDIKKARNSSIKQLLDDAPTLKKYLYSTFHEDYYKDPDATIETIQQMFGSCLLPHCKPQKAFFLLGGGSNGKSVLVKILTAFIGKENASSVPFHRLGTTDVLRMNDKLVNISSESDKMKFKDDISTSIFKSAVTGDPIHTDVKYKDACEFEPMATLIFVMNHLPEINDDSYGFIRRIVAIPFNREIPENEKITDLDNQIISKELKQLFIFALSGAIKLHNSNYKNFRMCEDTREQTEIYKTMINPFNDFMKTRIVINENAKIKVAHFKSIYDKYIEDTDNPNNTIKTSQDIGKALKQYMKNKNKAYSKKASGNEKGYSYYGIGSRF